jgi:hypothetical protein
MSGQFERRLTALEADTGVAAVFIVVQEPGESVADAIERRFPDGISTRDRGVSGRDGCQPGPGPQFL